jgi:cell filamentation protein
MPDRYEISGNPEAQFEPGSDGRVLRNLMGIRDPEIMDEIELDLLDQLYDVVLDGNLSDLRISANDLREWHRRWLCHVYPWAGKDRTVNMSKGNFMFAPAGQVPRLMAEFDKGILSAHTPCRGMSHERLVEAIAITHVEFILIHPFREGNGRLARLLVTIMARQAGWPEPDFSYWDRYRNRYFTAINAGLTDYGPMKELVIQVAPASARNEGGESYSPPT